MKRGGGIVNRYVSDWVQRRLQRSFLVSCSLFREGRFQHERTT